MLAAIVGGDYATGFELSLSSLYFIPVALVTLSWGLRAGIGSAIVAYAAWIGVSLGIPDPRAGTSLIVWEACIRFGTAAAFAALLDLLNRRLERESRRSRRDPLTRLPNRRAFFEAVEVERQRIQRYGGTLALAYIDLDDFKQLNDRHGHRTGDKALRAVAAAMRRHTRRIDMLARLGGDEFAIVYVETRAADAVKALELLRARMRELAVRRRWALDFSIGLAVFETVPDTVEAMISSADELMYEVKRQGKGRIVKRVF